MAGSSQSQLLQALGWATLNSFWQMALLWCGFLVVGYFLKLSSHKRYQLGTAMLFAGFSWFLITFFRFFAAGRPSVVLFETCINTSDNAFRACLLSASYAYVILLLIPAFQLYRNFRFVRAIRSQGLQKPDIAYRLFVQRQAAHMGIGKKVRVFVSELVSSPVTVGFVKPLILLPIAALNHLTVPQTEAILLHELSHIRRHDYLINLAISVIHTLLYFNPFVRNLIRTIEVEREHCCDELVLNYEYDKIGYASALLALEKLNGRPKLLVMEAAARKHIVQRIERIVGLPPRKEFKINQFAGLLAALACVILFNSVLFVTDTTKQRSDLALSVTNVGSPLFLDNTSDGEIPAADRPFRHTDALAAAPHPQNRAAYQPIANKKPTDATAVVAPAVGDDQTVSLTPVDFDDVEGSLTQDEQQHVQKTVKSMKKIMSSNWQFVEDSIADAMNDREKEMAKIEYLNSVKQLNWLAIEKNLKAEYNKLDWEKIDNSVSGALSLIQLDSLQRTYQQIAGALQKAREEALSTTEMAENPIPDDSVKAIENAQNKLNRYIKLLGALKKKKVVRL